MFEGHAVQFENIAGDIFETGVGAHITIGAITVWVPMSVSKSGDVKFYQAPAIKLGPKMVEWLTIKAREWAEKERAPTPKVTR